MLFVAVVALYSLTAHSVYAYQPDQLQERRRSCNAGLHDHHCSYKDVIQLKDIDSFHKSGEGPGKRDSQQSDGGSEDDALQSEEIGSFELSQDVDGYKQAISKLAHLLRAIKQGSENIPTQKRGCRFRLGGHCLTESLDRAANQYYYLKSPNSPGRRRRGVSSSSQRQAKQ
ncbi:hypothetical protein BsWGS_08163 [Bradybaena similaris]